MHSDRAELGRQTAENPLLDREPNLSNGAAADLALDVTEANREPRLTEWVAWGNAWRGEDWGTSGARCGGAIAQKWDGDELTVCPLLCGKWSCPVCGRLRYRWFVKNVEQATREHALGYFWTLTIDHESMSPADSWRLIGAAWNRFRTALTARYGPISFIWVVEPQKSGHAHLHVLWSLYVQHEEVMELWRAATRGSYVVWVERVRGKEAARYLAKYLQKSAGYVFRVGDVDLWKKHRYGKSRDVQFTSYRMPASGEWELVATGYKAYRAWAERGGRVLEEKTWGIPSFTWVPNVRHARGIQGASKRVYWRGVDVELLASADQPTFDWVMREVWRE